VIREIVSVYCFLELRLVVFNQKCPEFLSSDMLQNLGQPEKSKYSQKHDFLIRIHLVSKEKVVIGYPRNEIKHKVKVLDVMHCDFSA